MDEVLDSTAFLPPSDRSIDPLDSDRDSERPRSSQKLYYGIQMFILFAQNLTFQFRPIYARQLGANEVQMGLLTAISNVSSTFFSPFFGKRSDVIGRRMLLLTGGFIAATSSIAIALAQNAVQVIVIVGINGLGLSIITPAWSGALADYTENEDRGGFMGRLFGFGYAYVTVALVAFAFASPLLPVGELTQYRMIMLLSGLNFGAVIFLSWIFIDLHKPKVVKEKKYSIWDPLRDPVYRRFLLIILIWWGGMSFAWSYFPLVVQDVVGATPSEVAWIGIAATIVQALVAYRLGKYITKYGVRKSLIIGFLPFTFVPLIFAFATEWWHLIPAQLVAGIGIGFGFTAMETYILDIAGNERAGNYRGTFNILWGIVTFMGSLAGGFFMQWYSNYLNDLSKALMHALIAIAIIRGSSNILMVLYLPDP